MKLVNTTGLNPVGASHAGSSPARSTNCIYCNRKLRAYNYSGVCMICRPKYPCRICGRVSCLRGIKYPCSPAKYCSGCNNKLFLSNTKKYCKSCQFLYKCVKCRRTIRDCTCGYPTFGYFNGIGSERLIGRFEDLLWMHEWVSRVEWVEAGYREEDWRKLKKLLPPNIEQREGENRRVYIRWPDE